MQRVKYRVWGMGQEVSRAGQHCHSPRLRLRTSPRALQGVELIQINAACCSWQNWMLPAIKAPFPSGQHEGKEHQQWHSPLGSCGPGTPRRMGLHCCVCLVYKQDWRWMRQAHYQQQLWRPLWQIHTGVFPQKVKSLGPHGWHVSPGWMGWLCAQTLRAAVLEVEEEMEAFWEFPKQSFSSAMHVDFTPSSSKALSCEI